MSIPEKKPDLVRGWLFIERLRSEAEVERLEKLSVQELEAELRAEGIDPATIPTGEEYLEMAKERARKKAGTPSTE